MALRVVQRWPKLNRRSKPCSNECIFRYPSFDGHHCFNSGFNTHLEVNSPHSSEPLKGGAFEVCKAARQQQKQRKSSREIEQILGLIFDLTNFERLRWRMESNVDTFTCGKETFVCKHDDMCTLVGSRIVISFLPCVCGCGHLHPNEKEPNDATHGAATMHQSPEHPYHIAHANKRLVTWAVIK